MSSRNQRATLDFKGGINYNFIFINKVRDVSYLNNLISRIFTLFIALTLILPFQKGNQAHSIAQNLSPYSQTQSNTLTLLSKQYPAKVAELLHNHFAAFTAFVQTAESLTQQPKAEKKWELPLDRIRREQFSQVENMSTISSHSIGIRTLDIGTRYDSLVTAGQGGTVKLWAPKIDTSRELIKLDQSIQAIRAHPTERVIFVGSGKKVSLLGIDSKTIEEELFEQTGNVTTLDISSDETLLVSGATDNKVLLKKLNTDTDPIELIGHHKNVRSIVISPESQLIASAGLDKQLLLWNRDGEKLHTFEGHQKGITSLAFSPDGDHLISGDLSGTVIIWNIKSKKPIKIIQTGLNQVWTLDVAPEGDLIAVGGDGEELLLFTLNGDSTTPTYTLNGFKQGVSGVQFYPKGRGLAAIGGRDRSVYRFNYPIDPFQKGSLDYNVPLTDLNSILSISAIDFFADIVDFINEADYPKIILALSKLPQDWEWVSLPQEQSIAFNKEIKTWVQEGTFDEFKNLITFFSQNQSFELVDETSLPLEYLSKKVKQASSKIDFSATAKHLLYWKKIYGAHHLRGFLDQFEVNEIFNAVKLEVLKTTHDIIPPHGVQFAVPISMDVEGDLTYRVHYFEPTSKPPSEKGLKKVLDQIENFTAFTKANKETLKLLLQQPKETGELSVGDFFTLIEWVDEMVRLYLNMAENTKIAKKELFETKDLKSQPEKIIQRWQQIRDESIKRIANDLGIPKQELEQQTTKMISEQAIQEIQKQRLNFKELLNQALTDPSRDGGEFYSSSSFYQQMTLFLTDLEEDNIVNLHEFINALHQVQIKRSFSISAQESNVAGYLFSKWAQQTESQEWKKGKSVKQIELIDGRTDRSAGQVPQIAKILAYGVFHNTHIDPMEIEDQFNIRVIAKETEGWIYFRFGVHTAEVRFSYAPPSEGGGLWFEFTDDYDFEELLKQRVELLAAAFRNVGIQTTLDGLKIVGQLDKNNGARSQIEIATAAISMVSIISATKFLEAPAHQMTYLREGVSEEAFQKSQIAWAKLFAANLTLFIEAMLPKGKVDRYNLKIFDPPWDGQGEYKDVFTEKIKLMESFGRRKLEEALQKFGIDPTLLKGDFGQVLFDQANRLILRSIEQGKAIPQTEEPQPYKHDLDTFKESVKNPLEVFGELLQDGDRFEFERSIAPVARYLEKFATFKDDLGYIGQFKVQKISFKIWEGTVTFYALRHPETNDIEFAYPLWGHAPVTLPYLDELNQLVRPDNVIRSKEEILKILRIMGIDLDQVSFFSEQEIANGEELLMQWLFQPPDLTVKLSPYFLEGTSFSMETGYGRLKFLEKGSKPSDFDQAILCCPSLDPNDKAFLDASNGMAGWATGDLDHSSILAREMKKAAGAFNNAQKTDKGLEFEVLDLTNPVIKYIYVEGQKVRLVYARSREPKKVVIPEGGIVKVSGKRGHLTYIGNSPEVLEAFDHLFPISSIKIINPISFFSLIELMKKAEDATLTKFVFEVILSYYELSESQHKQLFKFVEENQELKAFLNAKAESLFKEAERYILRSTKSINGENTSQECFYHLYWAQNRIIKFQDLAATIDYTHHQAFSIRLKQIQDQLFSAIQSRIESRETEIKQEMAFIRSQVNGAESLNDAQYHLFQRLKQRAELVHDDSLIAEFDDLVKLSQEYEAMALDRFVKLKEQNQYSILKSDTPINMEQIVGYKANNSARLRRAAKSLNNDKIKYAIGFAIPTDIYREFMRTQELTFEMKKSWIEGYQHLIQLQLDRIIYPQLRAHSEQGQRIARELEAFTRGMFKEPINNASSIEQFNTTLFDVRNFLYSHVYKNQDFPSSMKEAFSALGSLAVRSSSLEEDTLTSSGAGQKRSALNVVGIELFFEEIIKVWESGSQAILVEGMIPSVVSGVAFSVNPRNNRFQEARVNSAYGLGEGVVSGKISSTEAIDPDVMTINRKTHRIIEKTKEAMGSKKKKYVFSLTGGLVIAKVPEKDQQRLSLNEDQIKLLSEAIQYLESHFGYPIDLEWAFDPEGNLVILQVRPITTLHEPVQIGRKLYETLLNGKKQQHATSDSLKAQTTNEANVGPSI